MTIKTQPSVIRPPGAAWLSGTEQLTEFPEELWEWVEERLQWFAALQEALRSGN